jgi:carotenoid cleavage dioxygenase-like enzyme
MSKTDGATSDGLRFPDLLVYEGYSAPSRVEGDVYDLEVIGQIPKELDGAYYRNCADPSYPPLLGTDIFLNGDGMVHMVRFENGHADLKTRYVRTTKFELERKARRALFGAYRNSYTDLPEVKGKDNNTANTSLMFHHGKLYALKESGRPYELDPETLQTLGERDFNGALNKTFTAHPKIDPETGECIAFAYSPSGPPSNDVVIYVISPEGKVTRSETFEAPYCSALHDFAVSRNYIVFTICPMTCDLERIKRGEPYWHWDGRKPVHVAVIPRAEGVKGIRWFSVPKTCMEGHTVNAWEEKTAAGTVLNIDHFVNESGWLSQFPDINDPDAQEKPPFGERWSIELDKPGATVQIRQLLEHIGEMPVIDPRYVTKRSRHIWFGTVNVELGPMLPWGPKGPPFNCVAHFDEAAGKYNFWYAGPDSAPEEPYFVPRSADAPEGEGWILTMVGRRSENRTDLVILDAQHLDRDPVAVVRLPYRIHEGFHGIWVGARALGR